jgi:hypothetical protein
MCEISWYHSKYNVIKQGVIQTEIVITEFNCSLLCVCIILYAWRE